MRLPAGLLLLTLLALAQTANEQAIELGRQGWAEMDQKHRPAFERALQLFESALALAPTDPATEAYLLHSVAAAKATLGDPKAAIPLLEKALAIQEGLQQESSIASTLDRLASNTLAMGDSAKAIALHQRALAIRTRLGELRGQAQTLTNLGLDFFSAGEHQAALDHYARALPFWRQLGDTQGEATTLHNMAEAHIYLRDWSAAIAFCNRALPLHRSVNDWPGYVHTLVHLGEANNGLGDAVRAQQHQQHALSEARQRGLKWHEATAIIELADSRASAGQRTQALAGYREALEKVQQAGWPQREAAPRLGIADTDPESASAEYAKALELARTYRNVPAQIRAHDGLARVALRRGAIAEARTHAEAAIAAIEASRAQVRSHHLRATFLATQRGAYELLLEIHLRAGRTAAALDTSERAHARALLELMAQTRTAASAAVPAKAAAIQAALDPGEVMLHYFAGSKSLFLLAVARDRIQGFALGPVSVVNSRIRGIRTLLSAPGRRQMAALDEGARQLSGILLQPAADILKGKTAVTIVADGPLYYLPFPVLPSPGSAGKRMIEDYQISYAPSGSIWLNRAAAQAAESWIGFSEPDPLPPHPRALAWPTLGGAAAEVSQIARLLPASNPVALTGKQAAEREAKSARLSGARYLHFAVHGWLDDQRPENSALVLAPSPGEDGLLRVSEVSQLRLRARLAILAACDTGLGPTLSGEGVLGLARAFLHAGAERVMVSLWPVHDQSTQRLTAAVYEGIARGDAPGQALRLAQLRLLADPATRHPYHWAPFIVMGAR